MYIQIIQPFSLLKPIRDLLRSRVVTTEEETEQTIRWTKDLHDACEEISLEVKVKVSDFELSFGELRSLSVGQILPIELYELAEVEIHGSTAFKGKVGEYDGKAAVELKTTKTDEFE